MSQLVSPAEYGLSLDSPEIIIFDKFGESQTDTPLSPARSISVAIEAVRRGVPLGFIADADLDPSANPDLFDYAIAVTIAAHKEAIADARQRHPNLRATMAPPHAVRAEIGEAFRINMAFALRWIIAAANNQEVEGPVAKFEADDPQLIAAQAIVNTPEGRDRTIAVLTRIAEAMQQEDADQPDQPPLHQAYKDAQLLGIVSPDFPESPANKLPREFRAEQLMRHLGRRLGGLAVDAALGRVIRTGLNMELDAGSLRLNPDRGRTRYKDQ